MKKILAVLSFSVCMAGLANAQFFDDNYDSYSLGPLAAQSLWEEWLNAGGTDADVVSGLTPDFSMPNALWITGQTTGPGAKGNDIVWDFSNSGGQPTSGRWIVSTRVMVPSTATGTGWFIMLNQYPTNTDWSVQLNFDATGGWFHPVEPTGADIPLVYDTWVDLVLAIDLDRDWVDIWYDGQNSCVGAPWIGTGSAQIACIDLYGGEPTSGGISELYYDNIRMVKNPAAAGFCLATSPGPLPDGGTLALKVDAPRVKSGLGMAFVTAVNGVPFVQNVLSFPLDAAGQFNASAPLGPGLSGVEVDLLCIGLKNSRLHLSNLNKLIIR